MSELICSTCGKASSELETFRMAMSLKLLLRKDYERLEKFNGLTDEQLAKFYALFKKRTVPHGTN